ncbi:MAG: hypothetical protein NC541_15820 [bacterium]|nr:hypothetical protein [bacterium]
MYIEVGGLDDLIEGLDNIMDLPEDVQREMLDAEADVVVRAQKEEIESLKLVDSGQLKASIAREHEVKLLNSGGMGMHMDIYPQGTREDGTRNAEVGFIHEYGAPKRHIKASAWMRNANEKCAEKAVEAAVDVYEKFLQKSL